MRVWMLMWMVAGAVACHREAPIVVHFEPADLAHAAMAAVATPVDAAAPAAAAVEPEVKKRAGAKAECATATDCVLEPEECCDCANGGKQHAIPKARAAASKLARDQRCKRVMCTMMFSTDRTCGKEAACVAGRCAMADRNK